MSREVGGIGKWGEDQAVKFLVRQGFKVSERNYNSTVGEIDIVATKGGDFYFVEVKTRSAGALAFDLAVTSDKKRKLDKTIKHYCSHRHLADVSLIPMSLMVVIDRREKKVSFRLSVLY